MCNIPTQPASVHLSYWPRRPVRSTALTNSTSQAGILRSPFYEALTDVELRAVLGIIETRSSRLLRISSH